MNTGKEIRVKLFVPFASLEQSLLAGNPVEQRLPFQFTHMEGERRVRTKKTLLVHFLPDEINELDEANNAIVESMSRETKKQKFAEQLKLRAENMEKDRRKRAGLDDAEEPTPKRQRVVLCCAPEYALDAPEPKADDIKTFSVTNVVEADRIAPPEHEQAFCSLILPSGHHKKPYKDMTDLGKHAEFLQRWGYDNAVETIKHPFFTRLKDVCETFIRTFAEESPLLKHFTVWILHAFRQIPIEMTTLDTEVTAECIGCGQATKICRVFFLSAEDKACEKCAPNLEKLALFMDAFSIFMGNLRKRQGTFGKLDEWADYIEFRRELKKIQI
jgi:ElaB/YqjD/DUF883 family membrane-anchored ribosome-binding protein